MARMRAVAAQYPRYGYRRIQIFLAREGITMSPDRMHRLWRRAGLQVPAAALCLTGGAAGRLSRTPPAVCDRGRDVHQPSGAPPVFASVRHGGSLRT
jgi:hypothetical protein